MVKETASMEFTGERFVPEAHGNVELEHLHRYLFACKAVAGKSVLDIASGEGYGSAMLARTANQVVGVDISDEAISHAQLKYIAKNLQFRIGSCSAIPVADSSIDVVVSFETIEHHGEHEAMMKEIKRVLRPGGTLIISSPDKFEYSDKPGYQNPYHVKELYRDEFKKLIGMYFSNQSLYGQRIVYGSALLCEDGARKIESYRLTDDAISGTPGTANAVYLIAVASDEELPLLDGGVFEQTIDKTELVRSWANVVAGLNREIVVINQTNADFRRAAELAHAEEIGVLHTEIAALHTEIDALSIHVKRILRSRSWRMTAPLRYLASRVRHIF